MDLIADSTPTADVDLDRLGDEIATLSAHLEAATARLLDLIRAFDARGGWQGGFRSCADWLSWRVGLDPGAARERVRVARTLGSLPQLAAALAAGEVSYAKVRAVTRVATPATEAALLHLARAGTAAHIERLVRAWRRVDRRAEAAQSARRHARRALQVYPDEDGMVVVRGRLEPEIGALLLRALDAARETLYQRERAATGTAAPPASPAAGNVSQGSSSPGRADASSLGPAVGAWNGPNGETLGDGPLPEPTHAQRQADALALLAETALAHGLDPGAAGDRYQVVLHVDAPVLADPDQPGQSALEGGAHVSAETSRRLACDASRVVMHHAADGSLLDVGRRTRTISPALRRALAHRDGSCRFPGCGGTRCQGHHIQHWANGGATRLGNLTLLCPLHHRAVHEEGYAVERAPDGALHFRRPDGRPLPAVPPPAPIPADPVSALVAHHRAQDLELGPRTGCPTWTGEPFDLDWTIAILHPAARDGVARQHATATLVSRRDHAPIVGPPT